ncbi:MAG TPA: amino acid deaminase/aldolase, partial [Mycobacteriales bacterium]|nr:amino acid deaminase/aldolase [Mycobacteriales bacterium]
LEAPFAVVDLQAFEANAADLVRRAQGMPIRVASKSVRCRALIDAALKVDGFAGIMAFTLPEALWLASLGYEDLLVAYPTTDRTALRALASSDAAEHVTVMVDAVEQLDLIASCAGAGAAPVRVCIDLDASWKLGRAHIGVRRSPVHSAGQAEALAREVVKRPALRLVGVMSYEAQIAGLGNKSPAVAAMQKRSAAELLSRRTAAVAAVQAVAPLELVNGGGTGSIETSRVETALTEVTAGSGLYGPTLFDAYRAFQPSHAMVFALPVVRRPAPGLVTVLGGGYPASGPAKDDRLVSPYLPSGLSLLGTEGAGEVQTPLKGKAADGLRLGDRVWFRHAKAGELCERFPVLHLVDGDRVVDTVPTYRGEGQTFL